MNIDFIIAVEIDPPAEKVLAHIFAQVVWQFSCSTTKIHRDTAGLTILQ